MVKGFYIAPATPYLRIKKKVTKKEIKLKCFVLNSYCHNFIEIIFSSLTYLRFGVHWILFLRDGFQALRTTRINRPGDWSSLHVLIQI